VSLCLHVSENLHVSRGLPFLKRALLLATVSLLGTVGCVKAPTRELVQARPAPTPPANGQPLELPKGKPVRVLFIGNSLTATNNLPAVVQSMAASGGIRLEYEACMPGGVNLEDHWSDGHCRPLLSGKKWDCVVLQQGPSSRPENQANLRQWSIHWADEARRVGAKPALYMVWPYQAQRNGFEQVILSYSSAAKAAKALLLPAGVSWDAASRTSPDISLYSSDRLHPTAEGTYLAALVITNRLTGVKVREVPAHLSLASGRLFDISPDLAKRLKTAAEDAVGKERPTRRTGAVSVRLSP
jgi:hypothetical protein